MKIADSYGNFINPVRAKGLTLTWSNVGEKRWRVILKPSEKVATQHPGIRSYYGREFVTDWLTFEKSDRFEVHKKWAEEDLKQFETFTVKISGTFFQPGGPITINGDGSGEYVANVKDNIRNSFKLSDEQLLKLNELLKATNWLRVKGANEIAPATDAVRYTMELVRNGETQKAWHETNKGIYGKLVMFLYSFARQEELYYQLTVSDKSRRNDAARDIFLELATRMGLPSHNLSQSMTDINFERYEPIFTQWLTNHKGQSNYELDAAIVWVGYLRRTDLLSRIITLKGFCHRSDWDSVCETLTRLGGPQAIRTLAEINRKSGSREEDAVSALLRLGAPGIKEILAIINEGMPPESKRRYSKAEIDGVYDRWYKAESNIRACTKLWDKEYFTKETKIQFGRAVNNLMARRAEKTTEASLRTEYFDKFLQYATDLQERDYKGVWEMTKAIGIVEMAEALNIDN